MGRRFCAWLKGLLDSDCCTDCRDCRSSAQCGFRLEFRRRSAAGFPPPPLVPCRCRRLCPLLPPAPPPLPPPVHLRRDCRLRRHPLRRRCLRRHRLRAGMLRRVRRENETRAVSFFVESRSIVSRHAAGDRGHQTSHVERIDRDVGLYCRRRSWRAVPRAWSGRAEIPRRTTRASCALGRTEDFSPACASRAASCARRIRLRCR